MTAVLDRPVAAPAPRVDAPVQPEPSAPAPAATRRFRFTVGRQVALPGVLGLLAVVAVAVSGLQAVSSLSDATHRTQDVAVAIRHQLEADMMHDALRGDVLAAVVAETDDEVAAATTELADHAELLRSNVAANEAALTAPAAVEALAAVGEPLAEYVATAERLAGLAVTDRAAARRELPAFYDAFEGLEASLGALSDTIQEEATEADAAAAAASSAARRSIMAFALVALAAVALAVRTIAKRITSRLGRCSDALRAVAGGDLTVSAEVDGTDELAAMATALDDCVVALRDTVGAMHGGSQRLLDRSDVLGSVAGSLSGAAEETSVQAGVVSAASEEVSASIQTVASAAEELGSSIREIAGNATDAARVAGEAVGDAQVATQTVARLGESSAEIGEVVRLITSIAEQTNLLALNATIEAARAGEAGKGFAVVANEVKELAKQTSDATGDIVAKVGAIQSDASHVSQSIEAIGEVISRIHEIQSSIAAAVEEQTAVTNEIARSVTEVATGSEQITSNISSVAIAADQTSAGAGETLETATELAALAGELEQLVHRFRV